MPGSIASGHLLTTLLRPAQDDKKYDLSAIVNCGVGLGGDWYPLPMFFNLHSAKRCREGKDVPAKQTRPFASGFGRGLVSPPNVFQSAQREALPRGKGRASEADTPFCEWIWEGIGIPSQYFSICTARSAAARKRTCLRSRHVLLRVGLGGDWYPLAMKRNISGVNEDD